MRTLFIAVLLFLVATSAATGQAPRPRSSGTSGRGPTPSTRPAAPPAMTNQDVIKMVAAGLSSDVIATSIRQAARRSFDLSVDGLVALKTAGVPDPIIRLMQSPEARLEPTVVAAPAAAMAVAPAPVKVPEKPAAVTLRDGTEVKLRLRKAMSSADAHLEDRVEFETDEDITVDNLVVIAKGAPAVGKVTEAQPKKSFGRQGKLNFTIDTVRAVDGQPVRLRATKEAKGGDSYGKAGVVTILAGPFGALVKGKNVDIAAGTVFTIFIDGDRAMNLAPSTR
jgi:hypothetical protein